MVRRLGLPVVAGLLVTGGLALADAGAPGSREPARGAARTTVHLPAVSHCIRRTVRVTVAPATGTSFTSLSVRVADDEVLQLSGLAGAGSVKVTLPSGRSRVAVSGTTSDGRFVRTSRRYRRCVPHPAAPVATQSPESTPAVGGGTDD